jgi:hypothetical protein
MDEILDNIEECGNFVQNMTDMSRKLPVIDESKLVTNPFAQELIVDATKIMDDGVMIHAEDGVTLVPAHHYVERQKATKLYHYPGSKERAMELSSGALRMLVYMAYTMDGSKDWLRVTPETYQKKSERGSRNTYKRAIDELITEGYITPTIYKYTYWVNPILMFAGSRIKKYPTKVKVKNTKD